MPAQVSFSERDGLCEVPISTLYKRTRQNLGKERMRKIRLYYWLTP